MSTPNPAKKFFGHPIQLSTLFHIELWERFSFYGMQGILMIYLYYAAKEGGLGIDKTLAGGIVGAYGGSVYLSTILGAWLADRIFGAEKTLFISGIVVMLGHILLAVIPGLSGLLFGLVCIALGSGGVKSSASSMVGSLYESDEMKPLRDAGFSIFYISINIGGFFGPIITGLLQKDYGFHYGFGAAAVGMAFGLWWYSLGRKNLPHTPAPNPLQPEKVKTAAAIGVLMILVLGSLIATGALNLETFPQFLLVTVILAVIAYFSRLLGSRHVDQENKRHIMAYIPLFITICAFWAVWFQVYTVATGSIVLRRLGRRMDENGQTPAENTAEIRSGDADSRRILPRLRALHFFRHTDADHYLRIGTAVRNDGRTAAVADFPLPGHQNCPAYVQNPDGGLELPCPFHRFYLGRPVVQTVL